VTFTRAGTFTRIVPRLLAGFLLVSSLPLAGLAFLYVQAFERSMSETAQVNLASIANKKADQIDAYLGERLTNSELLAKSAVTREALRELSNPVVRASTQVTDRTAIGTPRQQELATAYRDYYLNLIESIGYYDLLLTDTAGNVVFSILHEPDLGTNFNSGPFRDTPLARAHREALALLDTQITPVARYTASSNRPAVFIVTPVLYQGRLLGSIALQMDLDRLTQVAVDTTGLGFTGETVLAQRDGDEVLYVGPLRRVADAAFRHRQPLSVAAAPMQAALAGGHGHGLTRDYAGVDILAVWRHLPALNWGMVVKIDVAEALAPAHALRSQTLAMLVLVLLAAGIFALLFGRSLVRPIRALTLASRRIAAGEFDRRAEASGCDEFRELAGSFNRMADQLVDEQSSLEQRVVVRTHELRQSQARYEELTARIPVGVYSFRIRADGSMAFEYVSPRFCQILGLTQADVLADAACAFAQVQADERDNFIALNHAAARRLQPFFWEGRFVIGGATRWLRIESTPTPMDIGDSVWNGVMSDVTETRGFQEALRENESTLRRAQAVAHIGSWHLDLAGNGLTWSDETCHIFGIPTGTPLAYDDFIACVHEDDRAAVDGAWQAALHGAVYDITHRIVVAGAVKWVREQAELVFDGDGNLAAGIGTVQDVTAQTLAENAVKDSEHFLLSLADIIPGMLGYWDAELRCGFANAHYLKWFGKTQAQMHGIRIQELMGEELFRQNEPFIRAALRGETQHFERTLVKADGSTGYTWAHYLPNVVEDEVRGFFVMIADVTELKQTQTRLELLNEELRMRTGEAEAANRAKSEFLANMSHEIRTPMNAIIGLTQLVLDTPLAPKQEDFLRKAHQSSLALLGILNDILDYSKIEAGRLDIERLPFSVEGLLHDVAALFGARIAEKGLDISIDIAPDLPAQVLGDSLRLAQVLNNLVGNAIKFTEEGAINLKAEVAYVDAAANLLTLRFAVRDSGIGIDKNKVAELFQAFTQQDSSITRKYGGTGLGLTICQKLVGLMGGEITASGNPGQGATFSFTVLVGVAPQSQPTPGEAGGETGGETAKLPKKSALAVRQFHGAHILLVEDTATNQLVASELLRKSGVQVTLAVNGQEALDAVAATQRAGGPGFDAVLMDLHMPVMDGLEATRRIHALPGAADLPIIAMTAAVMQEDRDRCAAAGMIDRVWRRPPP